MRIPFKQNDWLLAGLGLVVVFSLLISDLLLMKYVFKWDAWYLFWPMFEALISRLSMGHLPLWEPSACCGFPFHADPQTGTFYPVFWLVGGLFGGGFQVYQLLWLGHWLWGIVGFFVLAKRMGCSPNGAFVGSLVFGFSGFFVGQASQTVCIITLSYIPWVMVLLDMAVDRGIFYAVPAGVLLGFTGLGGHPGMTVYSALMLVVWCLLKYGKSMRAAAGLGLLFLVSAVVLSPAYGSFFLEGRDYTDRVGSLSVLEACHVNRFPFEALVSLITPGLTVGYPALFGTTADRMAMLNGYFGILGLLSAVLVAWRKDLRREWAWLLWFMVVAFLLALGSAGGLKVIGHFLLPPLRFVRHPSFVRAFWMLAGGILAGCVFDRLTRSDDEERAGVASLCVKILVAMLYVGCCALLWAWLAADVAILTEPGFADIQQVDNGFWIACTHAGGQLALIILFILGMLLFRTSASRRLITVFLMLLVILDAATHLQTNKYTVCWNGKAASVSREFEQIGEENRGRIPNPNEPRIAKTVTFNWWAFDNKSYLRAYIAPKSSDYDFLVGSTWVPSRDTKFLKVLEGPPTFWLTPMVSFAEDHDKSALALLAGTDNTGPVPVFLHARTGQEAGADVRWAKPGTYGQVTVERYEPEKVVLQVKAPEKCWLFATERYAVGWKAYVDGEETQLYRADFCFRAFQVPMGRHVIRMEYAPRLYLPLLFASWGLSFLVLTAWGGMALARRGKRILEYIRSRGSL